MKYPLRIALGLAVAVIGLGNQTACATSYTNTIAQITAYITNQMAVNNIPGLSIALVDDQDVVWATGFGYADVENGVAADGDTVYHIGSCSKSFLGTAFMQLWEQGRVDLEAPLTNYMSEFSMLSRFTNSEAVTIRSLLNHHSGVPGDFFNGMITTRAIDDYAGWLVNCLQNDYPFAPVNERAYYCNSGFVLLSDVIRRITGTNFPAALDTMLFTPLGMDASSFLPDKDAISNRLAAAYNIEGGFQSPEILNALGSGSMYSSANDLTRYIRMILADGQFEGQSLTSSNAITTMTTAQLTNLPLNVSDNPQGLGWDNVGDYRLRYAGNVFWKDGATFMHSAFLAISRDLKLGVAVIQNTAGSQCDTIGVEALQWAILDKQGLQWPTNTFVPTDSPITNVSQAELDALAGIYVGNAGYNKIAAETGTLTIVASAHSDAPTIISNLVPRANGWFSPTNSQDTQLAFTNLAGHDMLVIHSVEGAFESVSPAGERYVPGTISAAWTERTNQVYRMVDMHPCDYFWETGYPIAKTLRFSEKDDVLLAAWAFGTFVIEPQTQNDNLAFQRGTHYRKGGAIQVSVTNLPGRSFSAEPGDFEILNYSSYRFLDEAAIPTLPVPATTNGSIPFANGTQWYWFTGETGQTYRVLITATGEEFFTRITDREGTVQSAGSNAPVAWTCTSNGTYAIAVSATNVFSFTASLTFSPSDATVRNDFDGDGKADMAVYHESSGYWFIIPSSTYSLSYSKLGASGYTPVPADFDGDGKADMAVYHESSGYWFIILSTTYSLSYSKLGEPGYAPVPADFDGDGKADMAVYQESSGYWFIILSSTWTLSYSKLGESGYTPVPADFDGDGKADMAVYQESSGYWFIIPSSTWSLSYSKLGESGYTPVPADFDGDGKADMAVYQESSGYWFIIPSSTWSLSYSKLGELGYTPVPADFDGDGKADMAVYQESSGYWFIIPSSTWSLSYSKLGETGYAPVW